MATKITAAAKDSRGNPIFKNQQKTSIRSYTSTDKQTGKVTNLTYNSKRAQPSGNKITAIKNIQPVKSTPVKSTAKAYSPTLGEIKAARRAGETYTQTRRRLIKEHGMTVIGGGAVPSLIGGIPLAAAGAASAMQIGAAISEGIQTVGALSQLFSEMDSAGNAPPPVTLSSGGGSIMPTMAQPLNLNVGITDISPNTPAGDIQVVDRRNILVDNMTGKTVKVVPVTAKIQRKRRGSRRSGISRAEVARMVDAQKSTDMMQMMMIMAMKG